MTLSVHLTFEDNCREAFEFYSSVFGSEFSLVSTYREGPKDLGVPEEELDRVMHVSLPIGSSVLLGGDACSALEPRPVMGNNLSISFAAENKQRADEVFAKLSDGGMVRTPMRRMFWGAYYGDCVDRFGISWQVIAEHGQSANHG